MAYGFAQKHTQIYIYIYVYIYMLPPIQGDCISGNLEATNL